MSMAPTLKILATGSYSQAVIEEQGLPELKELVKESTSANVRRVTRFVQLALVGAGRCSRNRSLPANTAVYLSSCRGDAEVTATLLDDLIRRRELPSPVTFVNSVSNAACFHVASALGLHERSNFITNRFDPLAAALKTAWIDFQCGEVETALVGSVDACSLPMRDHRVRVEVTEQTTVGEASHWLLLTGAADPRPGVAHVTALENFASLERLREWLSERNFRKDSVLAPGQHFTVCDAEELCAGTGMQTFDYRASLPHYDSQTGAAIEAFLEEREERAMLHINSDPAGRYSVILIERS
ncbi:hypothetical protein F6455_18740 [Proteobacteria bacterium 005FR1]|nr:hypothetical protein [Proteobacteria bacterium 005FR1]